jgi:hypothetical protein
MIYRKELEVMKQQERNKRQAQHTQWAQDRAKYIEENMRPYRPKSLDLTADEIWNMCEFSLGKEWWNYFFDEFPQALYPGGGGWDTMCDLKHTCHWSTWELLQHPCCGFFINVCGAHPRIDSLVQRMKGYHDDRALRPRGDWQGSHYFDSIAWDELTPEVQAVYWDIYNSTP